MPLIVFLADEPVVRRIGAEQVESERQLVVFLVDQSDASGVDCDRVGSSHAPEFESEIDRRRAPQPDGESQTGRYGEAVDALSGECLVIVAHAGAYAVGHAVEVVARIQHSRRYGEAGLDRVRVAVSYADALRGVLGERAVVAAPVGIYVVDAPCYGSVLIVYADTGLMRQARRRRCGRVRGTDAAG